MVTRPLVTYGLALANDSATAGVSPLNRRTVPSTGFANAPPRTRSPRATAAFACAEVILAERRAPLSVVVDHFVEEQVMHVRFLIWLGIWVLGFARAICDASIQNAAMQEHVPADEKRRQPADVAEWKQERAYAHQDGGAARCGRAEYGARHHQEPDGKEDRGRK